MRETDNQVRICLSRQPALQCPDHGNARTRRGARRVLLGHPARQPPGSDVLPPRRLRRLPTSPCHVVPAMWQGGLGLLSDAHYVHLLLVPADADALGRALGEMHRRYTRAVNQGQGWVRHLWQGRFSSCALDYDYVLAAARYIELNPVRARLVARPEDWPWSSAGAHLARRADRLVAATTPLLGEAGDWATFLASGLDDPRLDAIRRHERTGRPLGSEAFVADSISVSADSSGRHGAAASQPSERTRVLKWAGRPRAELHMTFPGRCPDPRRRSPRKLFTPGRTAPAAADSGSAHAPPAAHPPWPPPRPPRPDCRACRSRPGLRRGRRAPGWSGR